MKFRNINIFWGVVLCLSLFIGIAVRFYYGLSTDLWGDEATSYLIARNVSYEDIFFSTGEYRDFVHPPLYYIFLKICLLFGEYDWWLRLTSLAWFFPSLALVYLIAKTNIKKQTNSLIAISLFALHPLFNNLAFQVRPYPMVIFFMLLSIHLLLKQLKKDSLKGQLLTGLVLAISFYTDYASVWLIIGIFTLAISLLIQRKKLLVKITLQILVFFTLFSTYQITILTKSVLSKEPNARPGSVVFINTEKVSKEVNLATGVGSIVPSLFLLIVVFNSFNKSRINRDLKNEFLAITLISSICISLMYSLIDKPIFLARNLVIFSICLIVLISELELNRKNSFIIIMVMFIYGYNTLNKYNFLYNVGTKMIIRNEISNDSILISFPDQNIPDYLKYYLKQEKKQPIIMGFSNENSKNWLDNQKNKKIFLIDNCYNNCNQQEDEIRLRFCGINTCNEYFNR